MSKSLFAAARAVLGLDGTVAGIVTTSVDGADRVKIRRQKLGEYDQLPGIVLDLVADEAVADLAPPATAGEATLAVVCAAHNSADATALADAVRDVLDGFAGLAGDELTFAPCRWTSTDYDLDPADDDSDDRDTFLEVPTFDVFYRWGE